LSYYGDGTLGGLLSLTLDDVIAARRQLETAARPRVRKPLYQVLRWRARR